jgi:tetratricopeptide (TPR) repeat protein
LQELGRLLWFNNQLDAAEEATFRSIDLLPDNSEKFVVCQGHYILGDICRSKGETEKAIAHLKEALGIASSFNWHGQQFWILYSIAGLFCDQGRFDDAHTHIGHAKLHAVNDPYDLGSAMQLQARVWDKQGRLEEAKSEALCAVDVFEKLGAVEKLEDCRRFLQDIERKTKIPVTSGESDFDGKLPETVPLPTSSNSPSSARET